MKCARVKCHGGFHEASKELLMQEIHDRDGFFSSESIKPLCEVMKVKPMLQWGTQAFGGVKFWGHMSRKGR